MECYMFCISKTFPFLTLDGGETNGLLETINTSRVVMRQSDGGKYEIWLKDISNFVNLNIPNSRNL